MTAGAALAAAIGDVLAEWAESGYWPPRPDQPRLTAAMHANHCHPDFTYAITTGWTATPPVGGGWVENSDHPQHGWGRKPQSTSWMWRRPKASDGPERPQGAVPTQPPRPGPENPPTTLSGPVGHIGGESGVGHATPDDPHAPAAASQSPEHPHPACTTPERGVKPPYDAPSGQQREIPTWRQL